MTRLNEPKASHKITRTTRGTELSVLLSKESREVSDNRLLVLLLALLAGRDTPNA
jgi:hypothetical protein